MNVACVLVIWNASSSHYKIARISVEESACGECRCERPTDCAVSRRGVDGNVVAGRAKNPVLDPGEAECRAAGEYLAVRFDPARSFPPLVPPEKPDIQPEPRMHRS